MTEQALFHDVRQYLAMLHKRRGIIVTCLGVSFIVAILYNYTTRPVYQATTQILIDRNEPDVLPTAKEVVQMQADRDYYQTQYQILQGRMLAEKVVERLNLMNLPELKTGPLMSPWERFERRFLGRAPATAVDAQGIPLSPAVAAFRSRLKIEPVSGTRLVNVRFSAYEPSVAADAANAVAQVYMEQSLEFRFNTSTEVTGWLSDRLKDQQTTVESAEKVLQEYREREGLVNIEERQSLVDQKLATLNAAMMSARTERIAKESLYSQLRSLSPSTLESFPSVAASPMVSKLRTELSELQREQSRLAENLGDKHPDMQRVKSQIRATEEKLRSEVEHAVRAVESEARAARQQEASLQANLETVKKEAMEVGRKNIEYGVLKREVEANQEMYRNLKKRSKESGLESELTSTNIRIMEKAEAPRGPVSPQRTRNYQIALLVGLGLGIGLALLFEQLDNTFKTPEDIKNHLGLPFLGMVPDVAVSPRPAANIARPSPLIMKNPRSAVAEAYRVLRTNLIFSVPDETGRLLLVTSAGPGEGKTTTVANLASSLAINGAKVLAVDADLRRPTMHQHFGLSKSPGLSDLIVGKVKPSEAIQNTRYRGLQVLPCGYVPPNPTELLGSSSLREVLKALRTHYDWVLVDTPPVLAMADTPVLSPLADGVVLIVGAEISTRPSVQRSLDQIASVGGKILGVVLNKVNLERNSYYYGQYYGEYYRSSYADEPERRPRAVASGPRPIRRP